VSGVNQNVQNVSENSFLPPGAPVAGEETTSKTQATEASGNGEGYPAVTVVDEATHKAEEEQKTQERVERARSVSSPKRLNEREIQDVSVLLSIQEELMQDMPEPKPMTIPLPMDKIPERINNSLFQPGIKNNLHQRGILKMIMNVETKQYDQVELTEIGLDIYARQTSKGPATTTKEPKQKRAKSADGTAKTPGRRSNRYVGLRLKKLKPDPRQPDTMGWFSWQLYEDGMTYDEYMAKKEWPETYRNKSGFPFRGPGLNHWTWDLEHGFIGLYREGQPEFLEDGVTLNPKYWAIKNDPGPLEGEANPSDDNPVQD